MTFADVLFFCIGVHIVRDMWYIRRLLTSIDDKLWHRQGRSETTRLLKKIHAALPQEWN